MGKKLVRSTYPFDHDDMKTIRKKMNQYWNTYLLTPQTSLLNQYANNKHFDTVLGLTGAKGFIKGDHEYYDGISGLGGACGNGKQL